MPSTVLTIRNALLRGSESDIQSLRDLLDSHAQTSTGDPNEPSSICQSIVFAWSESELLLRTFLVLFRSDLAPSPVATWHQFTFTFVAESPGYTIYTRGLQSIVGSGPDETTRTLPKALTDIQAQICQILRECSPLIGEGHTVHIPWVHTPSEQREYRCSVWRFKREDRSFVCKFLLHV